ncbi:hypothetical protein [Algiphilus sp.]|uniref:hypothetical protein n=1 Tax=Algiphilus sp. TaxID=1872431 RepID=UPI001CA6291D|nr:hypothetical protein [Algiphilus acroporae]MCR9090980.1 hypothetical protein [Pseudomonadota bacterium]
MAWIRWKFLRGALLLVGTTFAHADDGLPQGVHAIALHASDGTKIVIGKVDFRTVGDETRFEVDIDRSVFTDYFLSMREFKCLAGENELQCRVPYPYASPNHMPEGSPIWLEHQLLFFYKPPDDFGANLRNGLIYSLQRTADGYAGTPTIVDLDVIAGPPDDLNVPPFPHALRFEGNPDDRWFSKLTVEKRSE